jgi:hypothetical protein
MACLPALRRYASLARDQAALVAGAAEAERAVAVLTAQLAEARERHAAELAGERCGARPRGLKRGGGWGEQRLAVSPIGSPGWAESSLRPEMCPGSRCSRR